MGEIQLFLVRVWRQQREFRAAVRGAGADEPRLFTAPEQVGEFLRQAVTPADTDAQGAETAPDEPGDGRMTSGCGTRQRRR